MKIRVLFIALLIATTMTGCVRAVVTANKMINNGFDTAYQQFKPSELLRKYEWFKDASAALDSKVADIQVAKAKMNNLVVSYGNEPRSKWSRTDAEQYNLWSSESTGIVMSYNELAGQYNSEMAKFNYAFTNVGNLPAGATVPLPREYKPYQTTF